MALRSTHVEVAHSVHVVVEGLEPAREYFYRFRARDAESAVGRAKTLPAPGADVARFRFASAGCQSWEQGLFTAWRKIAEDDLDLVVHYGDYIYEHARSAVDDAGRPHVRVMPDGHPRCINLADYRRRYGLYKGDADLQAAHAAAAFVPSFDDHEVANNWAADADPRDTPAEAFLFRRAAAFQAWYEHMPVRPRSRPRGPDLLAYRNLEIGRLANLAVLDTRQYRSKQACGDGIRVGCKEAEEPQRTMLGAAQERWLAALAAIQSRDVASACAAGAAGDHRLALVLPGARHGGRRAQHGQVGWRIGRTRSHAGDVARGQRWRTRSCCPATCTLDFAFDIRQDWRQPTSPGVGVEFTATSIASGGDGRDKLETEAEILADNPHIKFIGSRRGYTRHTITPKTWRADFMALDKVSTPGGTLSTAASFVVEAGKPSLAKA